jgi:hypothetical protein
MHTSSEREGFEPSRGLSPLLAFQASAFNRSTTSPRWTLSTRPQRLVAALLAALLVGATPAPARHALPGHYHVPQPWAWKPAIGVSGNVIANEGFESGAIGRGWFQCGDVPAYATTEHPYRGAYAEYSGTLTGAGEPKGNSGVCQRVTIPPNARLTARLYQLSNEGDATFAYQEADLLDDRGNVIVNLYRSVNSDPAWLLGSWNLAAYNGRSVWLYFGVHGDGYAGRSTQQFVDDVTLQTRAAPTPAAKKGGNGFARRTSRA